jgi:hypothetical protein
MTDSIWQSVGEEYSNSICTRHSEMRFRFCVVLFALSTLAFSQSVTSLRGRVTDPSHAVVPGAQVSLISVTTGATRAQVTSSDGGYEFPQMQPGKYS